MVKEKAQIIGAELVGSKKEKLTLRQGKFVKETVKTLNPTEAAKRAYNLGSKGGSKTQKQIDNTASVIACQNLRKLKIKESIQALMERAGFTDIDLIIKHNELIHSNDERIALSALIEAYKIKDKYPSQKIQIGKLDEIGDIITETDEERLKEAEKVDIVDVDKAKKAEVIDVKDKEKTKEKPDDKESQ